MTRLRSAAVCLLLALPACAAEPTPASSTPLWSLRPLVRPPVPDGPGANLVDRFLHARLRTAGLTPAPPADRRTLLRRVTFDLTGLPPTPEELDAFVADPSPRAYEHAVDRLLASPHHGERWARHWMDLAHFAETHGHDQDRVRPNAWPYRDYLIRSFNADKPYPRFVQEQVAADVLFPDDPIATAALGFLAAGPWDESSLRDIREDTVDRQIARYLDRDDVVTTVLSTFVSLTVHCARCHDHKFDPISMEEYYGLQAVFAGVDKADRAYEPDPVLAARRRSLMGEMERLRARRVPVAELLTPTVRTEVADWERRIAATDGAWSVLVPTKAVSANGAALQVLPDHSVLSGEKRPETDVYTITAGMEGSGLTGVRLDLLTDDSLPDRGPGRQDNGNLHLNEFKVFVGPHGKPEARRPVALRHPRADFDQDGWTVAHALDGNPRTAWGIYPQVGKPHRAVFEFAEPVGGGGEELTVVLEQTHGGGHLIGRLRLAVTRAKPPLSLTAETLAEAVATALRTPAERRTEAEWSELGRHVRERTVERELAALPPPALVYAGAADFKPDGAFKPAGKPRPVHVLKRGDIARPGPEARPAALACVVGLKAAFQLPDPAAEGPRRAALARWLTDPGNGLTWRSLVNRVWHYHFGRGLVDTPNDFGRMGSPPSHPDLLDWLAVEFRDRGGSLKWLHRLLVTSDAYRRASTHDPAAAAVDADNRLLWRMNRTRLDAESLRDALLLAAGRLDRTMGGPSVQMFNLSPGIHVTPNVDYLNYDLNRPGAGRRSVYRFLFRTLPDPFMTTLDCPDGAGLTPTRSASVTALQALALLHNRQVVRLSEDLAARAAHTGDPVGEVYRRLLLRPPSPREREAVAAHAARHGLANACRVLMNTNEFVFVD